MDGALCASTGEKWNEKIKAERPTERLNKLSSASKWTGEARRKDTWFSVFSPHLFGVEKLVGAITLSIMPSPFGRRRMSARSSTASPTDDQDVALEPIMYHNWITIQSVIIIVLQASMILFNHTQQGREQELHIQPRLSYLFTRHYKLNLTPI